MDDPIMVPCPNDYGPQGGIGGQTLTACPLCGEWSGSTALDRHRPVELHDLIARFQEQLGDLEVDIGNTFLRAEDLRAEIDRLRALAAGLVRLVKRLPNVRGIEVLSFWPDLGLAIAELEAELGHTEAAGD